MWRLFSGLLLAVCLWSHDVRIVRDSWGIAHIYGKTDADAVFGTVYAQAEDDFNRVEMNYLTNLGWLAKAEGESAVTQDLRQRLFSNDDLLQQHYRESPAWLQRLMDAFADGLNTFLKQHPETHPRVITHFEPWMALCFTEGSIGGDIERIDLKELARFYGSKVAAVQKEREPSGSNGMAIGPKRTADGHALLLINPHTSFFFRSELQMVSDEGLQAYGAVTWGQFFIYQGFNDKAGWMHTSSGVDAVDEWAETIHKKDGKLTYQYGSEERPVAVSEVVVPYRSQNGMAEKRFTIYRTHHGPVIREENGKWITFRMMQEPVKALQQSFLRTKARTYSTYRDTMQLQANSSNNTIFADADGDIAYFHGNYIPRRDTQFDWSKTVDGADPAAEWKGLLKVDEIPQLHNPASGWLFNVNNWPWSAAGPNSLKREDFPAYVENGIESARGRHALRVLSGSEKFTLDSLLYAAFDSYLPWFTETIPLMVKAYDALPESDAHKSRLSEQVQALRTWDLRWSAGSVPTSLAVFWGEAVSNRYRLPARNTKTPLEDYVAAHAGGDEMLEALQKASDNLAADFGKWQTPWGEINRYQRLTSDITQKFDDNKPSLPVAFTSSLWGSLASFGARAYPQTKKWYGTSGNSFVAVVEFGPKVRARAVTAGGESGHADSKHFNDEAQRYATGNLREVYFYPEDVRSHTEREYQVRSRD
jgi:acyl-homoserine-lactone acylase